jgi:hypothetical protein
VGSVYPTHKPRSPCKSHPSNAAWWWLRSCDLCREFYSVTHGLPAESQFSDASEVPRPSKIGPRSPQYIHGKFTSLTRGELAIRIGGSDIIGRKLAGAKTTNGSGFAWK